MNKEQVLQERINIVKCYFGSHNCDVCDKVEKCNNFLALLRKYDARKREFWEHFLVWLRI